MEFKVLYGFYILQNNAYNRQYFILPMLENQRKKIETGMALCSDKKIFIDKH